jgi:hypothetical protein
MIKKTLLVLAVIYTLQFLVSCNRCGCGDLREYDISIENLEVKTVDLSAFNEETGNEFEYFSDIGLIININFQETLLEQATIVNSGFSGAYACSCPDPIFNYLDIVNEVKIYEVSNSEKIDITSNFLVLDGSELLSVNDYFDTYRNSEYSMYYFSDIKLEMISDQNLTTNPQLEIQVVLDSGEELSRLTEILVIENS